RMNFNSSSCSNYSHTPVLQVMSMTVACIGLPLSCVAIFAVSLMVMASVYLINLLISDFIQFCCLIARAKIKDDDTCKIVQSILEAGVMVSICFMVVIALERYLVITSPLWYRFRRNIKTSLLVCAVVWLLPLLGLPFSFSNGGTLTIIVPCFLLLPFPLLLFFLVGTLRALSAARSVRHDEKRRIMATLVLVLLFYTLLFMPRIILFLYTRKRYIETGFGIAAAILTYLSPVVDMVLYVFMKKGFDDVLLKFLCCCKVSHDDPSISKEKTDNMNTEASMQLETETRRKADEDE
uniref:G-protein coupled receptors family 1 profile domain-containing protein n=1 Tax=Poecilia reticulata TaxID=8081 RepID=A0A3P9N5N8_POERE